MRALAVLVSFLLAAGCSCASSPATPDAAQPDAAHLADAGRDASPIDGGPRTDAGMDAPSVDAGNDVGSDAGNDAGHDAGNDADVDAGPPCTTPIVWTADPATEAPATAALAALWPTATSTWSAPRGTFQSIQQIGLTLDCPNGTELWDALLPIVTAHPDIFQIDLSEWRTPSSYPCAAVTSSIDIARIDRDHFGPGTVAHDFLTFTIVRDASGDVVLRGIYGLYLPLVPDAVRDEMARCGGLALDRARDAVFHATFPYGTYDNCVPTGHGTYQPGPLDVVALDAPEWSWNENTAGTGVELGWEQTGSLTIDPSYVTPTLESSDLNCPNADDTARVYGYRLTFDATTGALESSLPGLGCIVC